MRLGCGCLTTGLAVLVASAAVIGLVVVARNVTTPPDVDPAPFTKADGYSAQQKLYDLLSRPPGRSAARKPVVITEPEANAFLARHLDQAGLPLSPIVVGFARGEFTLHGQTKLRHLFQGPPFSQVASLVGASALDRLVWVTVRGRVHLEGTGNGRRGNVDVTEFAVGRQPLGSAVLWWLMGPSGGGFLRWPVPAVIRDITIGDRELTIATR